MKRFWPCEVREDCGFFGGRDMFVWGRECVFGEFFRHCLVLGLLLVFVFLLEFWSFAGEMHRGASAHPLQLLLFAVTPKHNGHVHHANDDYERPGAFEGLLQIALLQEVSAWNTRAVL